MALRSIGVASFCSGVGMLDEGLHAGLELVGRLPVPVVHVEREAYAAAVLVARMEEEALGKTPVWDDIKTFPGTSFRRAMAGGIAVAGLPCQGYSLAGKRLLLEDSRNLWPDMRRILRDMGCEWFYLENVPGFLAPEKAKGLAAGITRVLGDLAEDGWDAEWTVLSAGAVGASHKRDRVFLLAQARQPVGRRAEDETGVARAGASDSAGGAGSAMANAGSPERGPGDSSGLGVAGRNAVCSVGTQGSGHAGARSQGLVDTAGSRRGGKAVGQRVGGGPPLLPTRSDGADVHLAIPAGQRLEVGGRESGNVLEEPEAAERTCGAVGQGVDVAQCDGLDGRGRAAAPEPHSHGANDGLPMSTDESVADAGRKRGERGRDARVVDGKTRQEFGETLQWERDGHADVGGSDGVSAGNSRPLFAPGRTVSDGELRRELAKLKDDVQRRDRILAELLCWRDWQTVAAVDPSLMPCRERTVRGVGDGVAPGLGERADWLRAIGNGVVPLAAAAAFVLLYGRLGRWWA